LYDAHNPFALTILPCNDLDISKGGFLHLTMATQGWLVPGKNPFGLISTPMMWTL